MPKIITPAWIDRLTDVATFLLDHDCLPTKDGGPEQASMAQWLTHQRSAYNDDRLLPEHRSLLEALGIPQTGWMDGDRERRYDAAWFTNFHQVVAHLASTGRRPSTVSEDPEEQRLGKWLSLQLMTRDDLAEHRLAAFVGAGLTNLPNTTRLMHADTWHRRFADLDAFVTEHGRRPTHNSSDPDEKSIGQWLAKQRVAISKGTLSDDRLGLLIEAQERTGVDLLSLLKVDVVGAIIARVAAFHAEHGRMPTFHEPDGTWVANVRHRHRIGTLAPATAKALARIDPDWLTPMRVDLARSVQDIADFVAQHGRFPARTRGSATESRLAARMNSYRDRDRRGDLSEASRALLDEKVPNWNVLPTHLRFVEHLQDLAALGPDAHLRRGTTLYGWRYQLLLALRRQRVPAVRVDLIRQHAPWLLDAAGTDEDTSTNTSRASA